MERLLTLAEVRRTTDRAVIAERLQRNNWNVSKTARELDIQRSTLNAMIVKLALERDDESDED